VLLAWDDMGAPRSLCGPRPVGAGFRAGHHLAAGTQRGARTWGGYLEACG